MALSAGKVDVPLLHVGADEFDAKLVSHVESLLALGKHPLDVRLSDANEGSVIGHAGDDGVEGFANSVLHGDRGKSLGHFPLYLSCCVLFLSAVGGDGG